MGNSNTKNNPFSGKASSSYNWYESEQVGGCFLSQPYDYSISSGFLMINGKGNNKRESPSSSPSSEENKLPTKYKLSLQGKHPVWSFYVNEERSMMYECLEGNDKKEVNHDQVMDLAKEGRADWLAEFHVLAKIVQLVTDNQFGLLFSNAHNYSILLIKQQSSSPASSNTNTPSYGGEEIASFNRQDDRKLGASSFNGKYGENTMYESEVFCSDLDRVYLNFVMRKVEEIIKDQQHSKAPKTN